MGKVRVIVECDSFEEACNLQLTLADLDFESKTEQDRRYIIRCCSDMYIATWQGDPPRTFCKESAKVYKTIAGAKRAIKYYNKRYNWRKDMNLRIEEVDNG